MCQDTETVKDGCLVQIYVGIQTGFCCTKSSGITKQTLNSFELFDCELPPQLHHKKVEIFDRKKDAHQE
jgi:hypothetical protein